MPNYLLRALPAINNLCSSIAKTQMSIYLQVEDKVSLSSGRQHLQSSSTGVVECST